MEQLTLFASDEGRADPADPSDVPPYTYQFRRGIHYVFNVPEVDIKKEPFHFGTDTYEPGARLDKLGTKSRATLDIGKTLIYDGRIGSFVLFRVDEPWWIRYHIMALQVSENSLHMLSNPNTGWDITVKIK